MKKIILFFTIFSFAFSFAQKTNTRDYEDINARLDRLLREREVEKKSTECKFRRQNLCPDSE
jgi:low affinity Fe/Cu permease